MNQFSDIGNKLFVPLVICVKYLLSRRVRKGRRDVQLRWSCNTPHYATVTNIQLRWSWFLNEEQYRRYWTFVTQITQAPFTIPSGLNVSSLYKLFFRDIFKLLIYKYFRQNFKYFFKRLKKLLKKPLKKPLKK